MAAKRELIDTGTSKRYIRRDDQGRFTNDQVNVGSSHAADERRRAQTVATPDQADRGARPKPR
jgi:hypothetical protein